jgi:hypothetical protein
MDTAITQQFLNSGTQVNPWGTVATDVTGNNTFVDSQGKTITVPKFTQTTTLSPEQQAIFNQSQAAEGNLAGIANEQSAFLKDYLNKPFEFNNSDAEKWAFDLASPRIRQNQMQPKTPAVHAGEQGHPRRVCGMECGNVPHDQRQHRSDEPACPDRTRAGV